MSQSSKSSENKDVISKISSVKVEDKSTNPVIANCTPKRGLADQVNEQTKKIKVESDLSTSSASINIELSNKPKFVSASQLISHHKHTTADNFVEISDEELLEMAIQFEKNHPEYK